MKLTVRFWFNKTALGHKIQHQIPASLTNFAYVPYVGKEHPYKVYDGRITIIFDYTEDMEYFEEAVQLCMGAADLSEILIVNDWIQLKNIKYFEKWGKK